MPVFDIETLRFDARGLIPGDRPGRVGRGSDDGLDECGEPGGDDGDGARHVLVAVAGRAVAKRRDVGACADVVELRVDCDRDCLLLIVDQVGPACHTNRPSCFYTAIRDGDEVTLTEPEVPGPSSV